MVFFLLVCSWESFTTPAKDWKMPLDRRWWACQCAGTSKSTKMNSWFLVSNFSILCDWEMCSWAWKPERECTRLRACMCWFRSCFCCQKGTPFCWRRNLGMLRSWLKASWWRRTRCFIPHQCPQRTSLNLKVSWQGKHTERSCAKANPIFSYSGWLCYAVLGPLSINNNQRTSHDEWWHWILLLWVPILHCPKIYIIYIYVCVFFFLVF